MFEEPEKIESKHNKRKDVPIHDPRWTDEWNSGKPFFVAFVYNSCGHCHDMLPEWEKIVSPHHLFQIEHADIPTFQKHFESDPETMPFFQDLSAFPTIAKLQKGKPPSKHEGDREKSAFESWIHGPMKGGRSRGRRRGTGRTRFRKRKQVRKSYRHSQSK